jgi:hypothetical protein
VPPATRRARWYHRPLDLAAVRCLTCRSVSPLPARRPIYHGYPPWRPGSPTIMKDPQLIDGDPARKEILRDHGRAPPRARPTAASRVPGVTNRGPRRGQTPAVPSHPPFKLFRSWPARPTISRRHRRPGHDHEDFSAYTMLFLHQRKILRDHRARPATAARPARAPRAQARQVPVVPLGAARPGCRRVPGSDLGNSAQREDFAPHVNKAHSE